MVDDEETVRRGFETRIDWEGAGFEFLPPCENGRDAIEAMDRLKPDVVLTDICMPFEDGISVAAHAAAEHPETVVVVLSGFDEFRYAQEAIRHKVFDYILKPVTARDLSALLLRVKAKLDARDRLASDEAEPHASSGYSRKLGRERYLAEFLASPVAAWAPKNPEELFGFDPAGLACAVILAEDRRGAEDRRSAEDRQSAEGAAALRERFGRVFGVSQKVAVFFPEEGSLGALVFDRDPERCGRQADYYAGQLIAAEQSSAEPAAAEPAAAAGEGPPSVGIGWSYRDWRDAPRSYDEARSALAYRLVRDPPGPFRYPRSSDDDRAAVAEASQRMERLLFALRTGAAEQVPVLAGAFIGSLAASDLSPLRIRHEMQEFFARALDELGELGVSAASVAEELGCDYYEYVQGIDSRARVLEAIDRIVGLSARVNATRGFNQSEWKILDFKEYVERHYADPKLWIRTVAEALSISESYLSKILRRQLKCSFVEYLTGFRVSRARALLESTDLMTYEIADAVGYPDAGYFGAVFKRLTDLTPTEYRAAIRRGLASEEGASEPQAAGRPVS